MSPIDISKAEIKFTEKELKIKELELKLEKETRDLNRLKM